LQAGPCHGVRGIRVDTRIAGTATSGKKKTNEAYGHGANQHECLRSGLRPSEPDRSPARRQILPEAQGLAKRYKYHLNSKDEQALATATWLIKMRDHQPVPPSTVLLIPAYCESGRVGEAVRSVRRLILAGELPPIDLLVVDDGSSDGTAMEAAAAGARVVRHPFNLGYGSALHSGYCAAMRSGYQRVLQMDADGQHDPNMLSRLIQALDEGADIALGSRYLDAKAPPSSLARRVGTRMFSWIASQWLGTRITDPTSGFQGLSRRALESVANDGFPEDYPDTDVLIQHHRGGLTVREIPVVMHERTGGLSMHRGARIAYYGYKMLLTLLLMPIRRATPLRAPDSVARII
jgi:hypothetical protein